MKSLVSIIILNYNGKSLLETFLPFIYELENPNYEIIVVDNASEDDSISFIKKNFSNIKIIENGINLGYGGGNHQGVLNANGDFFWFLNTDVEVTSESLSKLIKFMKINNEVGISCPAIYYYYERHKLQCTGINLSKYGSTKGIQILDRNLVPFEVSFASGAALLIRKEVYFEIGGFDSDIFMSGDDVDLSIRCWLKGYKVFAVPSSIVYHQHGTTLSKESLSWHVYNSTSSMLQCMGKNLQMSTLILCIPSYLVITFVYFTFKIKYIYTIFPMVNAIVFNLKNIHRLLEKRGIIQRRVSGHYS